MTTQIDINEDLSLMIKEALADIEQNPDTAAETIVGVKNVLVACIENHGANRSIVWGMLTDQEKTTFKNILANAPEIVPDSFPEGLKRIKDATQSPSMQQQSCITEIIMGKRWRRTMWIAKKDELETALGSLSKNSDRYVAIQGFLEKVYPEKRNKFPVKKKVVAE